MMTKDMRARPTIRIPLELDIQIKQYAKNNNISMSKACEIAIADFLDRKGGYHALQKQNYESSQ